MTYVAAQKGIDGVSLLVLMLGNYGVRLLGGKYQIARQWLDREGVGVEARTFRFSGRTPMVGCVHSLSGAGNAKWMDDLISPSRRREIWPQELNAAGEGGWEDKRHECLDSSDSTWVRLHTQMARDTVDLDLDSIFQGKAACMIGGETDLPAGSFEPYDLYRAVNEIDR